jgi:hypothetical protein
LIARRVTGPQIAAYLIAAIVAASFAHDLMRKPIQVSDSLQELLDVQQSPSLVATFVAHSPRGPFLRPIRQVQIKMLFDAAGGRYQLAFRGFHAMLVALALFLFVRALQVRTWTDCAAAVFAITVLTGMNTFRGTVREAFPINHFLEIVVFCLLALNLAQSRAGWVTDTAAAVVFVVASLTLESGPLVWVVLVAAWLVGLRGVSRRALVSVTLLLAAYLWVRFGYLSIGTPGIDVGRDSGFGASMLTPEQIAVRFGDNPLPFYLYNVATSVLSVLFSDPDRGVFQMARGWLAGDAQARVYSATVPSILTTAVIAWAMAAAFRRYRTGRRMTGDYLFVVFGCVLAANAVLAYAYAKPEIISVAGAFYALATFVAVRYAIEYRPARPASNWVLCLVLAVASALWAFRSAGVHHMLQTQAFRERVEWARLDPERIAERGYPSDAPARALTAQLRREALDLRIANTNEVPAWADDWWGE